ncbi:metalloregulator ArsR/SmtB family transcription factor [Glaciihabitans sp. UYNi722]|uniref:ArsR/SmtB family transcription factor n=1 Tax=Glaciihabitans sp. UYNi722 TaxID=3156344 RepID=UPI00339AD14F
MSMATDELSRVFSALADPTRRDILSRLGEGPTTVGDLAGKYSMSRPAISQHLAVLDGAGLITRTVSAQWRECSVREGGLDDAAEWVAKQRAEWSQRLDFLEEHIRAKRKERS